MSERNLIGEGFVTNTLAPGGTISGTQVVSIPQMNSLVDGNVSTTAISVSGTFFISLDADLGARWKLNRIELYTDEPDPLNFDMSVRAEDTEEFLPITMTGTAGKWSGAVSGTTISGAPRFIRYEQRASTDRLVQEWTAINDDTLVEFGDDGSQTEAQIADAPIGKPSDTVTRLPLFNRFEKTAQGFVYIDETGNKGDDNIEISLSVNGPWFGRLTQNGHQPNVTPWLRQIFTPFGQRLRGQFGKERSYVPTGSVFEGTGVFFQFGNNLTLATGIAYETKFEEHSRGWTSTGFLSLSRTSGGLRGDSSTSTTPSFDFNNDFGNTPSNSPDSVPSIFHGFTPFKADLYDRVEINITGPAIVSDDYLEGPRLFWKSHLPEAFSTTQSVLSTTPAGVFTETPQTYTFELDQIPTWSGVIRSLKLQPWTTSTGISQVASLNSVKIFSSESAEDRIILSTQPAISGSFNTTFAGTFTVTTPAVELRTAVNTENPIKDHCIITQISTTVVPPNSPDFMGWFLCRFRDGFTYEDRLDTLVADGVAGNEPFVVKRFLVSQEENFTQQGLAIRESVLWDAEPGDMIGFAYQGTFGGPTDGSIFVFDTNLTTTTGGCLTSTSLIANMDTGKTTADIASNLNSDITAADRWELTGRRYNIAFKTISAGPYQTSGTYTTPVFDGGGDPALLSFEFDSVQPPGTSIDTNQTDAFKTVNARASASPPDTGVGLAQTKQEWMFGAHPSAIPDQFKPPGTSNYIIGLFNPEVTSREVASIKDPNGDGDDSIENIGNNVLYHVNKQEMWMMNILLSGTVSSDLVPIWDVYDVSGEPPVYLRTQHMAGSTTYAHVNNSSASRPNSFEAVGFMADYTRGELFVVTREDEFAVANGTYNGIIMDLEGAYKNVMWRNDVILQQIVDKGVAANVVAADIFLQNMRQCTYRNGYFYTVTNPLNGSDDGTHLQVFRLGNDVANPTDPNSVEFIASIDANTIPGSPPISETSPIETMLYVADNNLFYYTIRDNERGLYTFDITINGTPPNETVSFAAGPITTTDESFFSSSAMVEGFSNANANTVNNWDGAGTDQQLRQFLALGYNPDQDSFLFLTALRSNRTRHFVQDGQIGDDHFQFRFHTHTLFLELGAEIQPKVIVTPSWPNVFDATWGTTSGTLAYEAIQENSILFPTGRYAQLQYQLNGNEAETPRLLESRITQGLRVADIPASGTKNIFLRTNIPSTEVIGDQAGRLKVYWQLQEC